MYLQVRCQIYCYLYGGGADFPGPKTGSCESWYTLNKDLETLHRQPFITVLNSHTVLKIEFLRANHAKFCYEKLN